MDRKNSRVTLRRLVLYATWLSLAWAVALTSLAAVGNQWVLDRVAMGHFKAGTMPLWLRVVYGVVAVLMLVVAWMANRYANNDVTPRQRNLGRLIELVFLLSAIVNALSPSHAERYNAIGAAVTVVCIDILRRRPKSDYVDLRLRR